MCVALPFLSFATEYNVNDSGIAIHGYDPVAYFTEQKAVAGDAIYSLVHDNVTYQFKSPKNLEVFKAEPEHYLPRYGGYCSYGVRLGKKFDVDPTAWAVVENALYLQLNHGTQAVWKNDLQKNIEIAERLWPEIRPIPAAQLEETQP
jgi:YHS domain-containing protein